MKEPTKFTKVYLRQWSIIPKKPRLTKDTPIQIWHKEKIGCYEEIYGNAKHSKKSNFQRKLKIGNKIKTGEYEIANKFKKYFADIDPSLAKNIPDLSMSFEGFLKTVNTNLKKLKIETN